MNWLSKQLLRPLHLLVLLAVAAYASAQMIEPPERVNNLAWGFLVLSVCLMAGNLAAAVVTRAVEKHLRATQGEDPATLTAMGLIKFFARLGVWAIVLLVAFDNLGINISAMIAGLGIGGVAVALALQNVLGDLFGSLAIVLDKPFVVGDMIVVGDLMGVVESIGIKTTRLRSLSGEQLVFCNSDLLGSRIRNYKRMRERRVIFSLGVTYQTPHDKLTQIPKLIQEVVEEFSQTRFDRAHFKSYGDSALLFEVVYFVRDPDFKLCMDIQQAINLRIYQRFGQLGIDFAYPTRTVFVQNA